MKTRNTPYKCHVVVCTRSRNGEEKSCADADSASLKTMLKAEVKDRGWKGMARITESGCLGVCGVGPNVMIYPQGIWLSQVKLSDIPEIIDIIQQNIAE